MQRVCGDGGEPAHTKVGVVVKFAHEGVIAKRMSAAFSKQNTDTKDKLVGSVL